MTPEENRRKIEQEAPRSLPITISMGLLGLAGFGGALYIMLTVDALSFVTIAMVIFLLAVGIYGAASAINGKYIDRTDLTDIFTSSQK